MFVGGCEGEQLGGCDLGGRGGRGLVVTSCVWHPAAPGEASASCAGKGAWSWSAKSSNVLAHPTSCEATWASPWIWPVWTGPPAGTSEELYAGVLQ